MLLCRHQESTPQGDFGAPWVRVSTNDGATFGPDRRVVAPHGFATKKAFVYQVAAASASRLVVLATADHGNKVYVSQNGGRTWKTTLSILGTSFDESNSSILVGFQDPLTARIAEGDRVWTTINGGSQWKVDLFKK